MNHHDRHEDCNFYITNFAFLGSTLRFRLPMMFLFNTFHVESGHAAVINLLLVFWMSLELQFSRSHGTLWNAWNRYWVSCKIASPSFQNGFGVSNICYFNLYCHTIIENISSSIRQKLIHILMTIVLHRCEIYSISYCSIKIQEISREKGRYLTQSYDKKPIRLQT